MAILVQQPYAKISLGSQFRRTQNPGKEKKFKNVNVPAKRTDSICRGEIDREEK